MTEPTPQPRARIEILGPFRVFHVEGTEAHVPPGKNTALLACLAAEPQGVDRETLEATFWPDSSARARRQSLRQALSTLRKILGTDPFVVGERVRLDATLCTSDFDDFRDALWKDDRERCLGLFRGAPFTDVTPGVSVDFEHWLDRRREAALQRLGAVAQSMGRAALEQGDEAEAMRVVRLGTRGGLSEDALRAAIYGTRSNRPSWAAATVGSDGLETLTFRARPGLDSLIALVVEADEGWARDVLEQRARELPPGGMPMLLRIPEQTNGPEMAIADLLRLLVALPGGAAVRGSTLDTIEHLTSTPAALDDDRTRAAAESALADALDATLDEQALIMTLGANGIRLQPASILARALALQGGQGATVVVHGLSERELSGLAVQALVDACRELRHIRQSAAGSPEPKPPAPTMHRAEIRARLRSLGYLTAAAFAVGAAGLKFATSGLPPAPAQPLTDYDILFCSDRAGAFQYFRWSATTGMVERVTTDTAAWVYLANGEPVCRGVGMPTAAGDSLWLPVALEGGVDQGGFVEWRQYPNQPSRGDLRGRTVLADAGTAFGPVFRVGESRISSHHANGTKWILHLDTGARTALPEDILQVVDWSGPWALVLDGAFAFFRLHGETGTLERLTEGDLFNAAGLLRGDSLLFARGRQGNEEDGSLEILLRHIGTDVEERITDNDWNDYEVQWSPDGRHICWQSEELGHYQSEIMVMDLRSRRSWNLSASPGRDYQCYFTPDGRAVVYASLREGSEDLIIQPVSGGEAVNLSFYAGSDKLSGFVRPPGVASGG